MLLGLDPALTHTAVDEVLLITNRNRVEHYLQTRVFHVDDLIAALVDGPDTTHPGYDNLIELLVCCVHPDMWSEVGGPGTIKAYPKRGALICLNIPAVLNEINHFLRVIRKARQNKHARPKSALIEEFDSEGLVTKVYSWSLDKSDTEGGIGQWEEALAAEQLEATIQGVCDPDTWKQDGVFINSVMNRLVVHHREATHKKIEQLLRQLKLRVNTREAGDIRLKPGFF